MIATLVGCYLVARALRLGYMNEKHLTFSAPVVFAAMLTLGDSFAAVVALGGSAVAAAAWSRPDWRSELLSGAVLCLGALAAGSLYLGDPGSWAGVELTATKLLELLGAGLALFVVDAAGHGFAALIDQAPGQTAYDFFAALAIIYAGSLPLAGLMVIAYPWVQRSGLPILAVPLVVSIVAVRKIFEVRMIRRQLDAVDKIGRRAVGIFDLDGMISEFLGLIPTIVAADRCAVWLADPDEEILTEFKAKGTPTFAMASTVRFGEGLVGMCAERRRRVLVRNGRTDPRVAGDPLAAGTSVALPLMVHKKLIGVLEVSRYDVRPFHRKYIDVLAGLANELAVAIENHRLHERMHALAVTDSLTGLLNHRRLHEALQEEVWRAQRYVHPVSAMMIDVDDFKMYNDTYGHPKGDLVLKGVAKVIAGNTRSVDIAARYGGEEFVVILPETNKWQAERTAQRIRKAVESRAFGGQDGQKAVRKTVSIGIASFPDDTGDPSQLIALADKAMYKAKQMGKNAVVVSQGPPDTEQQSLQDPPAV